MDVRTYGGSAYTTGTPRMALRRPHRKRAGIVTSGSVNDFCLFICISNYQYVKSGGNAISAVWRRSQAHLRADLFAAQLYAKDGRAVWSTSQLLVTTSFGSFIRETIDNFSAFKTSEYKLCYHQTVRPCPFALTYHCAAEQYETCPYLLAKGQHCDCQRSFETDIREILRGIDCAQRKWNRW